MMRKLSVPQSRKFRQCFGMVSRKKRSMCFILDDHIDPRCSVLFLARSDLTEF